MRVLTNKNPRIRGGGTAMKRIAGAISSLFFAMLLVAAPALASPVSYVAELNTSNRNPVTNVLLLEEDEAGTVHAKVYGSALPGSGQVVIGHNPAFTPRRTLIIGLTDGLSPEGTPKTQIILFVNTAFAAAINGVKWSLALPGSSHSGTIASLIAATGGGATELGWFTGDFFKQIAAPAVFATGADFVVGEFSDFTPIGRAATIPVPGLAAGAMAALMLLLAGLAAFRLRRSSDARGRRGAVHR